MPNLIESIQGRDLGHFRIIADQWGIELNAPDARVALQRLAPALLDKDLIRQGVAGLPAGAREALDDLYQNDGRLPWPLFTRRYGAVREMGAGRRDRERPYQKSASPAEMLWYRALVGRSFFDTPGGAEEFAFIPDDLLPLLPVPQDLVARPLGRPATPAEREHPIPASDILLDHSCTLLAALRLGLPLEAVSLSVSAAVSAAEANSPALISLSPVLVRLFIASAGLLDENGLPQPEPARAFLEAGRGEALAQLAAAWMNSPAFNDLRLVPGLQVEGEWENDPLRARRAILDCLASIPGWEKARGSEEGQAREGREVGIGGGRKLEREGEGKAGREGEGKTEREGGRKARPYWSIEAFVGAVREKHPDFQRPAGDYDSWFLRDLNTGEFLRGFEHWDEVDGALIRFLLTGPLHWLGILDLAAPAPAAAPAAFRFSAWAAALLAGAAPAGLRLEDEPVVARSDGRLSLSRYAPRAVRYQVARFCAWEGEKDGLYRYRITPSSLAHARTQGLTVTHLTNLLARSTQAVPPNLVSALKRWEQHGTEAQLEPVTVLRVASPDLLQKLRNSKAARFLGDPLGPTAVIVKPGAGQKVLDILAEMGILGEEQIHLTD